MTMDSGTHEVFRSELAEFALGILDGRARANLLVHVETCPECAEQIQELSATSDLLMYVPVGAEPPLGFESAIVVGSRCGRSRPIVRTRLDDRSRRVEVTGESAGSRGDAAAHAGREWSYRRARVRLQRNAGVDVCLRRRARCAVERPVHGHHERRRTPLRRHLCVEWREGFVGRHAASQLWLGAQRGTYDVVGHGRRTVRQLNVELPTDRYELS
jgi:hypothetical protein